MAYIWLFWSLVLVCPTIIIALKHFTSLLLSIYCTCLQHVLNFAVVHVVLTVLFITLLLILLSISWTTPLLTISVRFAGILGQNTAMKSILSCPKPALGTSYVHWFTNEIIGNYSYSEYLQYAYFHIFELYKLQSSIWELQTYLLPYTNIQMCNLNALALLYNIQYRLILIILTTTLSYETAGVKLYNMEMPDSLCMRMITYYC